MTLININTSLASEAFQREGKDGIHYYHEKIETELGEKETFSISAVTA